MIPRGSYQSDDSQDSQVGSLAFSDSFVQLKLPPWLAGREAPSPGSQSPVAPGRSGLPGRPGKLSY
jgi:hypothetical protein